MTARLEETVPKRALLLLVVAYIIAFVDRTNIGIAKTRLEADLGISAAAYGLGAGLFFLTYALCEIPSNLILHRVGARVWITRIMVSWGLVALAMAFVQGPRSFYLVRLLLGMTEAGFYPGVVLYLTYWCSADQLPRVMGRFLIGVCLANILGGPLGGALLGMDGVMSLRGWQWLFILESLPAFVIAALVWARLPDPPIRAAVPGLAEDGGPAETGRSYVSDFLGAQSLLAVFVYFCHQIAIYTVTFFLPDIIGRWGARSAVEIGALNSLPWLAAMGGAMRALRGRFTPAGTRRQLVFGLIVMAAGLGAAGVLNAAPSLFAFCVAGSMFFVVQACVFTYPPSRLGGARLAAGIAFLNTFGLIGGFVGPTVMGVIEQRTSSHRAGLLAIALLLSCAALAATRLRQGTEVREAV